MYWILGGVLLAAAIEGIAAIFVIKYGRQK
jgi:hypothetical protein